MCGILAGSGRLSEGRYRGIAPECRLLCGKVLDEKGAGNLRNLLSGLGWVMRLMEQYPVRILNISIEMEQTASLKPKEVALLHEFLQFFHKNNVLIVAAAGNNGPDFRSISPIGEAPECICVGCHDEGYAGAGGQSCASYSARGPARAHTSTSLQGNPLKKPDIVAPGTDITACCHKTYWRMGKWQQTYTAKSGTSMATPQVSGALALCLQKYPQLTNIELRRILLSSARDLGETWSVQGAGMLNVNKMLENISKKFYKK